MFKIDYVINRKLSDTIEINLKPDKIPSELPNVVYIEGPNDSGKSTILNLIALSYYGLKNKSIKDSLKVKMDSLLNSDHQKIKFEVVASDKENTVTLRSKKTSFDDNEIFVEESINGGPFEPLSYDLFEKKYRLIYDIPERPTERLYDLLNEVEYEQSRYGEKIKRLNLYFHNIIKEIEQSRNPERLKGLKTLVKKLKKENIKIYDEIPLQKTLYSDLEIYYNIISYCKYFNELDMLKRRIEVLKEKESDLVTKQSKYSKSHIRLKNRIGISLDSIFKRKNDIKPMLTHSLSKKNIKKISIWDEIGVYNTSHFELDKNLLFFTNEFLLDVQAQLEKVENDSTFKNAFIFSDIIDYLKSYKKYSIYISKIDMNLNDFINILIEENQEYDKILNRHEGLKNLVLKLNLLKDDIINGQSTLDKMKEYDVKGVEVTEDITDFHDERSQIPEYEKQLKTVQKQYEYFYLKCIENDVDESLLKKDIPKLLKTYSNNENLSPYYSLDEISLQQKIFELKKFTDGKNDKAKTNDLLIQQYEIEIETLEKIEPHIYELQIDKLNTLLSITEKMSSKLLRDYDEYIKNLRKRKYKESNDTAIYYDKVFIFLAKKIGSFWNVDNEYVAKKVDLINNVIYTENDSTIYISDLGTGRGQSAYLKGLLNVPNDERKIIALFDEIAAMDMKSLTPIFEKISELYHKNQLMIGILVQKADEKVKVIPLEDI